MFAEPTFLIIFKFVNIFSLYFSCLTYDYTSSELILLKFQYKSLQRYPHYSQKEYSIKIFIEFFWPTLPYLLKILKIYKKYGI